MVPNVNKIKLSQITTEIKNVSLALIKITNVKMKRLFIIKDIKYVVLRINKLNQIKDTVLNLHIII